MRDPHRRRPYCSPSRWLDVRPACCDRPPPPRHERRQVRRCNRRGVSTDRSRCPHFAHGKMASGGGGAIVFLPASNQKKKHDFSLASALPCRVRSICAYLERVRKLSATARAALVLEQIAYSAIFSAVHFFMQAAPREPMSRRPGGRPR